MYAFQSLTRIYTLVLLFVCSALFHVSALADNPNAGGQPYWSTVERRMISVEEQKRTFQQTLDARVNRPVNSSVGVSSTPPTISKNATGGLSATSQSIIKNMGYPSTFSTTSNYSLSAAKDALKSCVRSPACAGRALGVGSIYYEGVKGWMDVYEFAFDDETNQIYKEVATGYPAVGESQILILPTEARPSGYEERGISGVYTIPYHELPFTVPSGRDVVKIEATPTALRYNYCLNPRQGKVLIGSNGSNCQYANSGSYEPAPNNTKQPVTQAELDQSIEQGYSPEVSDAPIVFFSGEPESLTLSTPSSAELPATTTTSTNSLGETETTVTNSTINYNVTNNNTSNPSIGSTLVENTTVYNDYGTVINTSTTTTTSEGVQGETSAPLEFELPSFCSWAEFLCDWLNWTKEPLDEEEPDLSVLISEFEPDEGGYSSGIGSGSCPAPMSLNLVIISRAVEVSYQPFCDFLAMIKPLVIAGAWLISAFMYVGVLRRG